MKLNTLLLAGAAAISFGAFAAGAKADTIYTTTGVAPGTTVTTTSGREVVNETYSAVGTRKVGLVGYHPYPLVASHVDSKTVRAIEPSTTISYGGPVQANSSVTTTTSTSGAPISYSAGGGNYYTEDGTGFYRNPNLNVHVRTTGSLND